MVISSNKKRVFNIILSVVIIAVILSGIGVGLFFIFQDKTKLTARQKQFGAVVNMSNQSLVQKEVSASLLSTLKTGDELLVVDENFALVKNGSDYRVIKNSNGETVNINSLIVFDKIETICENVAVVSSNGICKLIDLTSGNLIMSLEDSDWYVCGKHLLVKAQSGKVLKYYPNQQTEVSYLLLAFNAKTVEAVLEVSELADILDVTVSNNYLVLNYASETRIYSLSNFELLKRFVNAGQANLDMFNIESSVTENKFLMDDYTRAFELSENIILIENAQRVALDQSLVVSKLSNQENQGYKISYQIYDGDNSL